MSDTVLRQSIDGMSAQLSVKQRELAQFIDRYTESIKAFTESCQATGKTMGEQVSQARQMLNTSTTKSGNEPAGTARAVPASRSFSEPPKFEGKAFDVWGMGEVLRVAKSRQELEKWYEENKAQQEKLRAEEVSKTTEHEESLAAIRQRYAEQSKLISLSSSAATLGVVSQMTAGVADMMKGMGEESSSAYQVIFLASKAAAIAQAIVNTEVAAVQALSLGPVLGIPASALIRGLGYASVGMIAATTINGMAHEGIDNIPREGTWLLDEGERVVDRRTNGDLKDFLGRRQPTDDLHSGAPAAVQVTVNISGDGAAKTDSSVGAEAFGAQLGRFVEAKYRELIARDVQPGGALWRTSNGR